MKSTITPLLFSLKKHGCIFSIFLKIKQTHFILFSPQQTNELTQTSSTP